MPTDPIIEVVAEEIIPLYPIAVELSIGTVEILDPEGEPTGERLRLPDGRVTALNNDGGALNEFSEPDLIALEEVVATIPFLE